MNNTILKLVCLVLSVATAALSITLTVKFMLSIGQDMGDPMMMAALGLVLDLAKCASPLFILFLFSQKKYISTLFAFLLSVALSTISFSASVAALEQGVTASQQNSASYQRITSQIQSYEIQVTELRQLASMQQNVQQITKSQQTLSQVYSLLERIDSLSVQQANFDSEPTLLNKYGLVISYIASAALELMSWLLVIVANALDETKRTRTHSRAVERSEDEVIVLEPVTMPLHIESAPHSTAVVTHSAAVNDESFVECIEIAVESKCNEQLYLEIKQAILSKEVKPSQRGVLSQFKGVGRDTINQVLGDLKDKGILRPYRNGYAFA